MKAYYEPNASRPNFNVLLQAYVCRIVTTGQGEGLTATGVEFNVGETRDVHVAHARKEVLFQLVSFFSELRKGSHGMNQSQFVGLYLPHTVYCVW